MVLMTALLAILGLMPAALSSGVGSETQRPFAVVIITGLVTAVAVTLFVLPFAYNLVAHRQRSTGAESEGEA
jgi:heavy metal efflux system protein